MIRRGFWLTTGAVTGIVAYRRVSAVGRHLSDSLNLGSSPEAIGRTAGTSLRAGTRAGQQKPLFSVRRTRRTAIRATRETYRFTRDVREGMELYMARHSGSAGPTLSTLRTNQGALRTNQDAQPQARRAARLEAARTSGLRHDDEKDGH
jgi:hypothetical protein